MSNPNSDKNFKKQLARFAGIGFQMGAIIGGGTWLGHWLDGESADFPLYTLLFSLLSVFIALYLVIKEVLNQNK